jgi:magnesium-transporting ATPase (P-type)
VTKGVNTHLISGSIGLAVCLIFWFARGNLSPFSLMFPNAVLLIIATVSAALVVVGLRRPEMQPLFAEGSRRRLIVTALTLLFWFFAIGLVGFFTASVVAFSFLVWYLASANHRVGPSRLALWVVIVAAEVGFFYLVFTRLLHVPLPRGLFF